MAKNIKHQIQQAINNAFDENIDKHAFKKQNLKEKTKIFSFQEKFRLLDTAKMLNNFIKENYKDIKQIKDIDSNIIQNFLNTKKDNCTQNTINTYKQSLNKIADICNKNYKSCNLDWKSNVVVPAVENKRSNLRGVKNQIPVNDLKLICNHCKNNFSKSQSAQIILIQSILGIRINEILNIKKENIDFNKNIIHLTNCKGGKNLDRTINKELKHVLMSSIEINNIQSGKLFNITDNAVNKFLGRLEKNLNISGSFSTHNIRATIAQNKFDELRENGTSRDVAIKEVSHWLNHGDNREAMLKECYVNIW